MISVSFFSQFGFRRIVFKGRKDLQTYLDVKKAVGKILGIKENSLQIFGIFSLFNFSFDHFPPKKLCLEEEQLPFENLDLGFFRVSFDRKLESIIIQNDANALLFMYWEVSYSLYFGTYIKDPEEVNNKVMELSDKIDEIKRAGFSSHSFEEAKEHTLSKYRMKVFPYRDLDSIKELYLSGVYIDFSTLNSFTTPIFLRYLKLILCFMRKLQKLELHYWSYYYVAEGILCGDYAPLLASCLNLNSDHIIYVTVAKTCLSFLGENMTGHIVHLLDFPWKNIITISKKNKTFSFQIMARNTRGNVELITINVFCNLCDYIYSMAYYVLKQIDEFMDTKEECKTLYYLTPSSFPGLCGMVNNTSAEGEKVRNKFFTPKIFDMTRLFAHNVACMLAGPGILYEGQPINFIIFNNEEELSDKTSCIAKINGRVESQRRQRVQHTVLKRTTLQMLISEVKEGLRQVQFSTKSIIIHTFWKDPIEANITQYFMGRDLKNDLAAILNLKKFSLRIFGLFLCSEKFPTGYNQIFCQDNEYLPQGKHFCLCRLSIDPKLEKIVRDQDPVANRLLWSEAKYMFNNNKILPALSEGSINRIRSKLLTGSVRSHLIELINAVPEFWWDYYMKADSYCDFVPATFTQPSHVAINSHHVFLLDRLGLNCKKIPLEKVLIVRSPTSDLMVPKELVIEVLQKKKVKDEPPVFVLECVTIRTLAHEMFLGLAKMIFTQTKILQEHKKEITSEKFCNSLFQGPSYSILHQSDVCEALNLTFVGLTEAEPKKN